MDRTPYPFETLTTPQSIFDYVAAHLRRQGRPAYIDDTGPDDGDYAGCRYRLALGDGSVLSCAVGCLIPDELYQRGMEGTTVEVLPRILRDGRRGERTELHEQLACFLEANRELLRSLQVAHDEWNETPGGPTPDELEFQLRNAVDGLSLNAGVTYTPPKE